MRIPLLLTVVLVIPGLARAEGPTPDEVRKAVARSLPYLEKEGLAWIQARNCNSCHVVPFMLWSHNEAQARGIAVDAKKLAEWTEWSLNSSLELRKWYRLAEPTPKDPKIEGLPEAILDKLKPLFDKTFVTQKEFLNEVRTHLNPEEMSKYKTVLMKRALVPKKGAQNDGGGLDTVGQLLLSRGAIKNPRMDEYLQAASVLMAKWQESNGSWKAAGQLPAQNRPAPEADQATTGWALLALESVGNKDPLTKKTIAAGLSYFQKTKPGKSHETLLVHLLLEKKVGKTENAETLLKEVLARQNPDGGWSWLHGASTSDGFATGQTLYALNIAGLEPRHPAVQKGQKYLLDSQTKEGIWAVPPQAVSSGKAPARLKKLVPIYHYWGTAWAAIGLSRSLAGD